MTDEELMAIEDRHSATTPEEWIADIQPLKQFDLVKVWGEGVFYNVVAQTKNLGYTSADAFFIASAHQDVPKLIKEVRRLRKVLNKARKTQAELLGSACQLV